MTAPRKALTFYEAVELRELAVHAIEAHADAIRAASTDGEDVEAASAAPRRPLDSSTTGSTSTPTTPPPSQTSADAPPVRLARRRG